MRIWCGKSHKKFQSSIITSTLARAKTCSTAFCSSNRRSRSGSPRNVIPKWAEEQKTATTQNDRNCVRISNFSLKNQKSLKWVDFSPIYSCPRQKLRCLQLVPKLPYPKNWAKSSVFMPISMFLRVGQLIWWHSNRANAHIA